MSTKKMFQALRGEKGKGDPDSTLKSSWENVLLQILLPIVLILALTSLTKLSTTIKDYKLKKKQLTAMMEQYKEKREKVTAFLSDLQNTKTREHVEKRTEAVIELQKQKLFKALGEMRYDEKMQFGIYLPSRGASTERPLLWRSEAYLQLFSAEEISIREGKLSDEELKRQFNRIYDIMHGEDARNTIAVDYYITVLRKTGLKDRALKNNSLLTSITKSTDTLEQSADALTEPDEILPDNRKLAWKEIQDFLAEIEHDTVTLQRAILDRIIDYYIEHPDDLDSLDTEGVRTGELKRLIKEFAFTDRNLRREQRNRILAMIELIFHNYLDNVGYRFLGKTWQYYEF
jgi:hypothetical protein